MLFAFSLMVISVSVLLVKAQDDSLLCGKREWKKNDGDKSICQLCPKDTFMDEDGHRHEACKKCKEYSREIDYVEDWEPCTRERDAIVRRCADIMKMFIEYNPSLQRYQCIPCRAADCLFRTECRSKTDSTAGSTPATTADSLGPSPSPADTHKPNITKYDDVVPVDTVNPETVDPAISYGEIAVIVASCLIFLAVCACVCLCYRRRQSQTYRTYELANSEISASNKTDNQKSTTTITYNGNMNDMEPADSAL